MLFEKTQVMNLEGAIRGMRNPMDSWELSDSGKDEDFGLDSVAGYHIGQKDMELACKLIKGGTEHRKFLRQIFVSVDITAPRYWWQEFDTYAVGVAKNSCSTMHKLQSKPFDLNMFAIDETQTQDDIDYWNYTIDYLNRLRDEYNKTKGYQYFRKMKQALPESFLQKRTVTLNYENILAIRKQRVINKHRLVEWNTDFDYWSGDLPYIPNFERSLYGD